MADKRYSYDSSCERLAEGFLSEFPEYRSRTPDLAQAVQERIEDWIKFEMRNATARAGWNRVKPTGNDLATQESASAKHRAYMVELTGIQAFTCDDCPARVSCDYAFDAYNTDGDCLAEK